jgi:hypothetical protein
VSFTSRVIVVTVDGEDRDRYVDILVLVVDMVKGAWQVSTMKLLKSTDLPAEHLASVAEKLELARLVAQTVFAKTLHDLIHRFSRRLIVMKQVAC